MNKKGGFQKKTGIGIAFIFGGLIVAIQLNLIIGIVMMGVGVFLVSTD